MRRLRLFHAAAVLLTAFAITVACFGLIRLSLIVIALLVVLQSWILTWVHSLSETQP